MNVSSIEKLNFILKATYAHSGRLGLGTSENFDIEPIRLSTKYNETLLNHNLIINFGNAHE